MARHFTLSEAERLLPQVERAVREAVRSKKEFHAAETEIDSYIQWLNMLGGAIVDRHRIMEWRARRDQVAEILKNAIATIHSYGCEVKDLDMGLIDFRSYYRGEEVYLCWKLGEEGISYWHGLTEGFRGRKRIDRDFLDHHQGDRPN